VEDLRSFNQPVLVETYLPGKEYTAGIRTGEFASHRLHRGHFERGSEVLLTGTRRSEELVEYRLVEDTMAQKAIEVALASWRGLGCRDGGRVDLRADANGLPHFLEVNPLAGLNPVVSDLPILCTLKGMSYQELISQIMESALSRMPKETSRFPSVHSSLGLLA
jgi:D-alanine-D-alanine ligase